MTTESPGMGHNSDTAAAAALTKAAKEKLGQIIAKVERLEEEKAGIASDIKDVYAEAKSMGYDTASLRWLVKERKLDERAREERDSLRAIYAHAIDMEFYD